MSGRSLPGRLFSCALLLIESAQHQCSDDGGASGAIASGYLVNAVCSALIHERAQPGLFAARDLKRCRHCSCDGYRNKVTGLNAGGQPRFPVLAFVCSM